MIRTREELNALRDKYAECLAKEKKQVLICGGTGCVACGSMSIYDRFIEVLNEKGVEVDVKLVEEPEEHERCAVSMKISGCHGFCECGPLVRIEPNGWLYIKTKVDDVEEIVEKSLIGDEYIDRLVYHQDGVAYPAEEEIPFYAQQQRQVLENCGRINVGSLEEYIAHDGYQAVAKALCDMTREDVIDEMTKSNLRGRGGAGFPTGIKWKSAYGRRSDIKYILCNGDEGDPGAFMDRSIMEGDPHRVLEGMIIGAYAIGAKEGYIYVRAEYPLAIRRLETAIKQAKKAGLIGENILGTKFSFDLHINKGAGAFVCGEETALIESVEGNRGMPRIKPPRADEKGLFDKPSIINNVETYANVAMIINKGADWYLSTGCPGNPGTKAFALTGNVQNTGLIEVPLGTTLRKVIFDIGGGIRNGKNFKAVQIGGPSGGCLTEEHLDLPLDFDSLKKVGAMIGSGGMIVMDESTCMVDMARFFLNFTQRESCGKCVHCRLGTKRMLEILTRITEGKGKDGDMELLQELAEEVREGALCGLGNTAPNPILSSLRFFANEYRDHIYNKKCTAHSCKELITYAIDPEKCKGCSLCSKKCPTNAISGEVKKPFVIDQNECIKCGTCKTVCRFGAVTLD